MTVNSIPFNPMGTSNFSGTFSIISDGYVQGVAMDDPSVRNALAGGVISPSETLPMQGGVLIYENVSGGLTIPVGGDVMGGNVGRATGLANATGICVLNQAHHFITSPQSEAPVGFTGTTAMFYRFGSGARVAVAIDPSLGSSLQAGLITQPVSWDFTGQRLVPYIAAYAQQSITGATWANGVVTLTFGSAHGFVAGNDIVVANMVPAGYNGSYTVASAPTTTTLTYALAANPGNETVLGIVPAGGGAFPGRILNLKLGNSKTYFTNANGGYSWNSSGSCALVLI